MAEEYLNLSYHGIRAREKNFACQINFSPDSSLPRINLVPQDIGRVLLNICNNAFYSVNEKRRLFSADGKNLREDYSPVVMVQTKKIKSPSGNGPDLFVEIRIRDNGLGISPGYKDKIFQPFFTTKPAGQGTGLGLSLSYDIITKEHHGTIELESREGEYAEFVIRLPMRDIG
jgi:signal transduction histidine kinase